MNRTLTVATFAEPHLREPMGIENRHAGYVYFVDGNIKIRWAGCSHASPEEIPTLLVCTSVLLNGFSEKGKRGGGGEDVMAWECWNQTKGTMRVSDSRVVPCRSSSYYSQEK